MEDQDFKDLMVLIKENGRNCLRQYVLIAVLSVVQIIVILLLL